MIRNIRVSGREYPPETFRRLGWRGRWVIFLNAIRVRIERSVQWHVMRLFDRPDTKVEQQMRAVIHEVERQQAKAITHFQESRGSTVPLDDFSEPAVPPEVEGIERTRAMIARLTATDRAKRYTQGRRRYPVYEAEEASGEANDRGNSTADRGQSKEN
jgi:hypothetical protein